MSNRYLPYIVGLTFRNDKDKEVPYLMPQPNNNLDFIVDTSLYISDNVTSDNKFVYFTAYSAETEDPVYLNQQFINLDGFHGTAFIRFKVSISNKYLVNLTAIKIQLSLIDKSQSAKDNPAILDNQQFFSTIIPVVTKGEPNV